MANIVHFETLGCRLNQDETEGAAYSFSQAGYAVDLDSINARSGENPDVILSVINTCTVTGKAEQKARRLMRLLLEKFPNAPLIVTGCYAELDSNAIKSIAPERIVVLPGRRKSDLGRIASRKLNHFDTSVLEKIISEGDGILPVKSGSAVNPFTLFAPVFEKHSRSSIKIQDGCNNSCAFCRIHFARGTSVSLAPETVLERVKTLCANGSSEIVLTGVNLSQYSATFVDGTACTFSGLLRLLLDNTRHVKFRISSFYPQSVTEELCQVIAHERVQPFFHLSIQSGSDTILSAMNRPYKRDAVLRAVSLIKKYKGECFISCDIIAGFPGETDDDFQQTVELCNECGFSWIHAFPFSPRPGTAAQKMKPQIPERIKDERVRILTQIAQNGKIEFINSCAGKTFDAVVENSRAFLKGLSDSQTYHAVTDNFIHVEFKSSSPLVQGTVVQVKIKSALEENIRSGVEVEASAQLA